MTERKRKGLSKEGGELEGREESTRLKLAAHTLIVFFLHHYADFGGKNTSPKYTSIKEPHKTRKWMDSERRIKT
jgi:hypothetical protein